MGLNLSAHTAVQWTFHSLQGHPREMSRTMDSYGINSHQKQNEYNAEDTDAVLLEH